MLAGEPMDRSAILLNDKNKTKYTYAVQVPYLNQALDELMESMEENNISVTNERSAIFVISAGVLTIPEAPAVLPTDLIEIQEIKERESGGLDTDWIPVTKVDYLPILTQATALRYWSWLKGGIKTIGATGIRDVRIDYIAKLQVDVVDENSSITILNSKSFLTYRTAGLCARFIGENPTRADSLDTFAGAAIERILGIDVKANQGMPAKRKPFMFAYKRR